MLTWLSSRSASESMENPANPLGKDDDDFARSSGTDSGIRVTREKILGHPTVMACHNILTRAVARLPVHVYKREGEGKNVDTSHPADYLLRHRPDPEMSPFVFKQTLMYHALRGNAYAYVFRDGNRRPTGILPLNPEMTAPIREGGKLWYGTIIDNETRRLDASDVIHIKGLSFDGREGHDIVRILRDAFSLGLGQRKFRAIYFKNNGRPNVALEAPPEMSEQARENLIKSWKKASAGLENAHRAVLLEEGVKVHAYSSTVRDSQLIEGEEHEIVQIANIYCVPPSRVGAKTNVSYKSLEQDNQRFLDDGVDPWLVQIEEECREKLLSQNERRNDTHTIKFNRRAVVQANMRDRAAFYNLGIMGGWLNRDEVRAAEDYNPIPDGEGQEFLVPLNMGAAGMDEPPADEDDPDSQQQDNNRTAHIFQQILARDRARMIGRIGQDAHRVARKGENFLDWLDKLEEKHGRTVSEALLPSLRGLGHDDLQANTIVAEFVRSIHSELDDLSGQHSAATFPAAIEAWEAKRKRGLK